MTLKALQLEAKRLRLLRANASVAEAELRMFMGSYLKQGMAKEVASAIGVSEQYLSDIRNGRRLLSDKFLEKLCGRRCTKQSASGLK